MTPKPGLGLALAFAAMSAFDECAPINQRDFVYRTPGSKAKKPARNRDKAKAARKANLKRHRP